MNRFFAGDLSEVQKCIETLDDLCLDGKARSKVCKLLFLLIIGEQYGHHTLRSILDSLGVSSNNYQKVWQKISCQTIIRVANAYFSFVLSSRLQALGEKSISTHSRANITLIIDGSVFKQWLENELFGKYYAKYFSGQTHRCEYGFHLILLGISIGEDFYPFRFHILRKDKGQTAKSVACKLLQKAHSFLANLASCHSISWGKLYLSIDSGFRCPKLLEYCEQFDIAPIVACTKSHNYIIDGQKAKLSTHIEQLYKKKEEEHKKQYADNQKEAPAFVLRVKAYYSCMKKWVILVFFRVNHSKKVSVVFTTYLLAQAKTVRRRFFQRVKIEQFFRFVKHTLKIQQSTSKNFIGFLKKVALFFLKAVLCLAFQKKYRKMRGANKKWGFERIRRYIMHNVEKTPLEKLVFSKTFCTDLAFE